LPLKKAICLLEDYCSKLKKPEEQQLKTAILRVMGIFKSSLFQALIGKLMFVKRVIFLFNREIGK
uniref:L27-1 domain-containing protein n=1 Tax=Sinocyclocheilus rhinocerous TaxID=307959 RepID=A0A673M6K6_9TELE